ncbi:MAG: hypothetical protein CO032_07435 [Nitrosopumilales archaeon CG_4_9_14_0_2_um_filter_34_16]|nr:MAG: hypothetical protein CO032_07435 [Nitrosopumilales archaeon CG_4_9_14_0_2_um_filter_34_16]
MVEVTKDDAIKAIQMCLENTLGFLEDARILISKNRHDRLWMQFQFAFEELGKTNFMLTQLENEDDPIQMNNDIRTKHEIQMAHIKNLARITPYMKDEYERVWLDFPMLNPTTGPVFENEETEKMRKLLHQSLAKDAAENFTELDQAILDELLDEGHQLRKDCRVNFDVNTGKPYKAEALRTDKARIAQGIIEELVSNFQQRLENIS